MTTTDHALEAEKWLEYSGNQNPEIDAKAMHAAALAQGEASLAVAYELRTANLIAALSAGYLLGHDHEDEAWDVEIRTRLGLDGGAE